MNLNSDDPRIVPVYSVAEAARYIGGGLKAATLRTWVKGRFYPVDDGQGFFEPLIELPDLDIPRLSFLNLVEAHVLYALRKHHNMSIRNVRTALDYAQSEFGIERLLVHKDLQTAVGDLFLDHYGQLVSLSRAGQLGLRRVLSIYLEHLNRDEAGLPVKLFPVIPLEHINNKVSIAPSVFSGRPIFDKSGVSVFVLARRYDGGEEVETLVSDYGLEKEEVEEAITYYAQAA